MNIKKSIEKNNEGKHQQMEMIQPTLTIAGRTYTLPPRPLVLDTAPRIEIAKDGASATLVMIRKHNCDENYDMANNSLSCTYSHKFRSEVDRLIGDTSVWVADADDDAVDRIPDPVKVYCLPEDPTDNFLDIDCTQWRFPLVAKNEKEEQIATVE